MAGASGSRVASKTGVMSPLYDPGPQVFRDKETVSRASTGARLVTESLPHLFFDVPSQDAYDTGTGQNGNRILGGGLIRLELAGEGVRLDVT